MAGTVWFSNMFTPQLKVNLRLFVDIDNLLRNNPMGRYADRDPLLVWDYPVYTLHSTYPIPAGFSGRASGGFSRHYYPERDEILTLDYTRNIIKRSVQKI